LDADVEHLSSHKSVLADLDRMISALIKENRELQRQIDKLSGQALGATSGTAERVLRSIQRRIHSAVVEEDPWWPKLAAKLGLEGGGEASSPAEEQP